VIPITSYQVAYEITEDCSVAFKGISRAEFQTQFNSLINATIKDPIVKCVDTVQISKNHPAYSRNGEFLDDAKLDLEAGMAIKILKIYPTKNVSEAARYYWKDWIKFSILHPSLKGIQFKTVGRYDIVIHGRDNMRQLSNLKIKEHQ